MRSWIPHRPSNRIYQRIFAADTPGTGTESFRHFQLSWMAGAVAICLLIALWAASPGLSLRQRMAMTTPRINLLEPGFLATIVLSNHSFASINLEQNILQRLNFDWTNGEASFSSAGPLEVALTNRLRQ